MESTHEKTLLEVAEIQLTYRSKVKASLRPKITSSKDCENILRQYWDEDKIDFIEEFKVILLNRANKPIGLYEVSNGSTTHTVVDPRLVFVAAIKANACAIILSHNHPSGNLTPSQADIDLTKKMKEAGKYASLVKMT